MIDKANREMEATAELVTTVRDGLEIPEYFSNQAGPRLWVLLLQATCLVMSVALEAAPTSLLPPVRLGTHLLIGWV